MSINGVLTDCITGKESVVDLDYEIFTHDGLRYFQLINGVTGFESFYIDDYKSSKTDTDKLERIRKNGWRACVGTKEVWDELYITSEEMTKALDGVK